MEENSTAITNLPATLPFAIAFVTGSTLQANLANLGSKATPLVLHNTCSGYLAGHLTSTGWNAVFNGQPNDAIVPVSSQNMNSSGIAFTGIIHSPGAIELGFVGPSELESASGIPDQVVLLLNEKINGSGSHFHH